MKIDQSLMEGISQLASIRLNQEEKEQLLVSLNNLIEDFSCLHDFQVEEEQKSSFSIELRADVIVPCSNLGTLHQNFPNKIDQLLVAPLIYPEEK